MKEKSLQYRVADKFGDYREGAYETPVEAEVAIERMRLLAVKRKNEAEIRAQYGHPWCTDGDELKAPARFEEAGYHVAEEPITNCVYRLNADISNDADFVREVLWKIRALGFAQIVWTCIGHTRSQWQGDAAFQFLTGFGFACMVEADGRVVVKAGKAVL